MRKFILRSKTSFVTLSVFAFLFLNQSVVYSQNGCLVDQTRQDFQSGTPDANTYISSFADGEVILNPTLASEFSGSTVPAGFTDGIWTSGGTTTFNSGIISLNGTHIASNNSFSPGTVIEFSAAFRASSFQNIGFASDFDFDNPWVTFSTGSSGDGVYARASDGSNVLISAGLLGSFHLYRIEWNSDNFAFYVDNALVTTLSLTIASNMVVQLSMVPVGNSLDADWIHISPYSGSGSFLSRVYDGGEQKSWQSASWTAQTPTGTSIQFYQRQGNTATPDNTWTDFAAITSNGDNVGGTSRYIQYRADLSTTNTSVTPVLQDFQISCTQANAAPQVTTQPSSQNRCASSSVSFTSAASGAPSPTVQWQVNSDGSTWNNISGATSATLTFTATSGDDGNQYRAVWTNTSGSVNSDPATLTVTTINVSATPGTIICSGGTTSVTVSATGGIQPYTGTGVFNNVAAGGHTYNVTDANQCNGSTGITIQDGTQTKPAQPSPIVGAKANLCGGSNIKFSVNAVATATSYNWTVPAGISITQNNGTSIRVNVSDLFATNGKLSVSATNQCGASPLSQVLLYAVAPKPFVIGPTSVTAGQTSVIYSVQKRPRTGLLYTWHVPGGSTIISGQGTNAITVNFGTRSGYINIYESNECGASPTGRVYVTVSAPLSAQAANAFAGKEHFTVYPNPTTSTATISFDQLAQGSKYEIRVTDIMGKIIMKQSAIANSGQNIRQLDLSNYPSGIYIVTVISNEGTKTLKVYKEK